MHKPLKQTLATLAILLASFGAQAQASDYPTKPIRIIVTSAPGGLIDVHTRAVAKLLGDQLGQPFVVDNRAGAGGLVAIRSMKTVPADGYTLMTALNTVAIQQVSQADPGYDLTKDFAGIGMMSRSPFVLIAPGRDPDKTLPQFIARAKAQPGVLSYASAGQGSTTHLSAGMFARRAGIDLMHVPYKGNSSAWPDLRTGRVNLLVEGYATALPMVSDGSVKILGVTGTSRMAALPNVPTLAEAGAPGYSFYLWTGLLAPAGTPKEVVQKLSNALRTALANPELRAKWNGEGTEAVPMNPEEFNKFLHDEVTSMNKVVTDLQLPKQ